MKPFKSFKNPDSRAVMFGFGFGWEWILTSWSFARCRQSAVAIDEWVRKVREKNSQLNLYPIDLELPICSRFTANIILKKPHKSAALRVERWAIYFNPAFEMHVLRRGAHKTQMTSQTGTVPNNTPKAGAVLVQQENTLRHKTFITFATHNMQWVTVVPEWVSKREDCL